ncbi:MAG: hypothetical protein IJR98_06380 [Synergistaceae bacterium]|nr:hypothetical protein [Synergistaceae bacterium]
MKKLMITLMFVLTATSVSFGAVSEDMSVYLRKDVFDAKMEAFMNEIRGEFQVMNAKIDALSRRVDDNFNTLAKRIDDNNRALERRMDGLDKRIDDVRNGMYILFVVLGIILSLPIFQKVFSSFEEWKASKRQFTTIEDVKRLIAENNAKPAS